MPPNIDDVIDEARKTDEFLLDMQRLHRRRIRNAIRKSETKIVNLMKQLETNEAGRIDGIKVNLKQAQKIQKDAIKVFATEYNAVAADLVEDFDEIDKFIRGSFRNLDESIQFTGIDNTMINTLKEQALEDYEQFGLQAQRRIATATYDSVIGGADFGDLVDTMRGIMRGHEDIRGVPMTVHAETHAFDSVMNHHNRVNLKKAEDLGINHYLYVGDIIKTTRRFCAVRAGKVYTRGQIESWNRLDWAGKRGPAFEFRGGWRCRHHWRPVRPEWMEDEDGEAVKQIEMQDFNLERSEGT